MLSLLMERVLTAQEPDAFRSICLQQLSSFLYSQREQLVEKAPSVKDALERQDKGALPKSEDPNIKRAAALIDAILNYRTALQKVLDEVKDERIKTSLKKYLAKWAPVQPKPNKQ